MTVQLIYPVGQSFPVTQTYDEHIQRAKQNGWCWKPGNCPGGVFYYGGIDWGCPLMTPVVAAAEGVISKVSLTNMGYGRVVYVLHPDGYTTIYAHNSQLACLAGDKVQAGQVITKSGSTGNSTGPHLHFELRDPSGLAVDPMPYLTGEIQPPPVQPPIQPPVVSGFKLPALPALPRYKVADLVTKWINIRDLPYGRDIGDVMPGTIVEVFGYMTVNNDVWFAIKTAQGVVGYAAAFYNGEIWMEPVF